MREQILFRKNALLVEVLTIIQKNILEGEERIGKKAHADGDLDKHFTGRTPCKCYRCGSEDHLIDE